MNNYENSPFTSSPQAITFGNSFISKVFFFFGLAVLASAAGAYVGLNYLGTFFIMNPALIYGCLAAELILVFTSRMWSQTRPLNYLLFLVFAFITGITIVPLLAMVIVTSGIGIVIKALLATTLMFTAAAVFGITTNLELRGLRGFLFLSLIGMIIVGILGIFIPWGNQFEQIYAGFGIILFSGYTMYDIQRLKSYDENHYIDAALQLYLDIFNLFIFILRLISSLSRR